MRKAAFPVVLAGVALVGGCVPCLRPIYTDKDLVFETALVGLWSGPNSAASWHFTKSGEKAYRLVHTDDKGRKGVFDAHLAKLDGMLFLDLYPQAPRAPMNELYQFHIQPVHTFLRVYQITPALQMSCMDPKWLKEYLEEQPDALRHEKQGDRLLVTASTEQLQAFLIKHGSTDKAFGEPSDLKRQSPQP
jgi:hypothetical protein